MIIMSFRILFLRSEIYFLLTSIEFQVDSLQIEYKNLTWVWGRNRKFRPEGHCLASRGCTEWCKTVIPKDGIFFPHRTLMFDSFSCIPFDFRMFYFKSCIYYHTQGRWRFFKMTSLWRCNDVNLMTKLRDVLYNLCKPNALEKKKSFWGEVTWVR